MQVFKLGRPCNFGMGFSFREFYKQMMSVCKLSPDVGKVISGRRILVESCDHKVYVIIISNCVRVQYKVGFDGIGLCKL